MQRFGYFWSAWPHLFAIECSASPGLVCIAAACPQQSVQMEGWARTHSVPACVVLLGDPPGHNKGKSAEIRNFVGDELELNLMQKAVTTLVPLCELLKMTGDAINYASESQVSELNNQKGPIAGFGIVGAPLFMSKKDPTFPKRQPDQSLVKLKAPKFWGVQVCAGVL